MVKCVKQYLYKRGISGPWEIKPIPTIKFNQVIVIPAYGESKYLFDTLESINNATSLQTTLVIVVINNSSKEDELLKSDNDITLNNLKNQKYNFILGVIDASSFGYELPIKHAGVGLARKIGIDLALPFLISKNSLIFCLDSDTIVSKKYIDETSTYFSNNKVKAAVIGFKHQVASDSKLENAIRSYEHFLFTTANKLKNAGSPYGYVAMGSTMVCTVEAYCSIGGMPRKKATEDFYFLQELAKYSGVKSINTILVFPSPRPISRVYLGTGYRMKQVRNGFNINSIYYSDNAFNILSEWIKVASSAWQLNLSELFDRISTIDPRLQKFIINEGIGDVWEKIQINTSSKQYFSNQFHRWFDGLKTIRFLKYFS